MQQAAAIEAKIKKICEAFRAKRYDLPEMDDGEGVKKLMYDNYGEMHDARVVLLKVPTVEIAFGGDTVGCGALSASTLFLCALLRRSMPRLGQYQVCDRHNGCISSNSFA